MLALADPGIYRNGPLRYTKSLSAGNLASTPVTAIMRRELSPPVHAQSVSYPTGTVSLGW